MFITGKLIKRILHEALNKGLNMLKNYSAREVAEIEKRAIAEFGIPGRVLMENAGRGLARLAVERLGFGRIVILCGPGNNGGDGLAAARFLKEAGASPQVLLFCPTGALKEDSRIHYDLLRTKNIPILHAQGDAAAECCHKAAADCSGIIDALFGVGINRPLLPPWCDLVNIMNESGKEVISADLPSGLNTDTGEIMGVCVRAAATAVFGLLKIGLTQGAGPERAGDIRLIDIGLPPELLSFQP